MNPSVDDRLASIVRSLTDLVLPALPPEAGLAQEQVHLAIGHLKILRAQFDAVPAFEAAELSDTHALARALLADAHGGPATEAALGSLRLALDPPVGTEHVRETRVRINGAIDVLIRQMSADGDEAYTRRAGEVLVRLQGERARKDRRWFALMGFDSDVK